MTEQRTESNIPWVRFLMAATPRTLTHIPRILALDGGGVRGLSSLLIVQRLMHEVHRIMSRTDLVCCFLMRYGSVLELFECYERVYFSLFYDGFVQGHGCRLFLFSGTC